jgi:phage terminase large subunit-like protein
MFNKEKFPFCAKGHQYALDIISGDIPSNKWVKGACQRYLDDLEKIKTDKSCSFYFLPEKAEKYLRIVQKLDHAVGDWDTKKIIYEPWQCFAWMNIKGFYSYHSKKVRFRTIHLDVARGNAKSTMASQACLYDLCCDEPNGNRVYCCATSRLQAGEVLEGSQIMARKNKSFLKNFKIDVMSKEILHKDSNSFVKAISAQANNADGKIGKLIVTDELHAMGRRLFETLISGQSKRRDSQILSITTAGYANDGIGASQRSYAKKVAIGEIEDDTFFSMVYCVEDDDDFFAGPEVWVKANPNFGISVDPINFKAQAEKAKINPEDKAGFLIKHLNMYLGSSNQYFNVARWKECRDESLTWDRFFGKKCYVGIDIASKVDITSVCFLFRESQKFYAFFKNYVPEARLSLPSCQIYHRFVEDKDLIPTQGEAINLLKFYDELLKDLKLFKPVVHADPWNAAELLTKLNMARIDALEYPLRVGTMSEPMKKMGAEILEKRLHHNSGSMLEWCLGNVVAKVDANDNVYPRKEHDSFKIDPVIACIMAFGGWVNEDLKESVYEERGIIVL